MGTVNAFFEPRMRNIALSSIVSGEVSPSGDLILTTESGLLVNAGNLFGLFGSKIVASKDEPLSPIQDELPVLWLKIGEDLSLIPAVPLRPHFDVPGFKIYVPDLVGIYYTMDVYGLETVIGPGVVDVSTFGMPFKANVTAHAEPGYVLLKSYLWSAMYSEASAFSLYASDSFAGVPGANVVGRVWDNALGGAGLVTWKDIYITANRLGLNQAGNGLTRLFGTQTERWGQQDFDTGADNWAIELDFLQFAPAHSREFRAIFGCTSNGSGGISVAIVGESTTWDIYFRGTYPALSEKYTYRASAPLESHVTGGPWRIEWIDKFLQVEAPDGMIFGYDYSNYVPSGWAWGQTSGVNMSDYNAGNTEANYPILDGIRLYR